MKAFHFVLTTGERGTLAGCADDMTLDEALACLNFQFTERVESVTESGRDWPDMLHVFIKSLLLRENTLDCISEKDSIQEGDGPLLLLERLQNIQRRVNGRKA